VSAVVDNETLVNGDDEVGLTVLWRSVCSTATFESNGSTPDLHPDILIWTMDHPDDRNAQTCRPMPTTVRIACETADLPMRQIQI
jgi:hypothetical protein